jgi:hypothetical protein
VREITCHCPNTLPSRIEQLTDVLLRAVANRAGIKNAHPHALRPACGHALAMKGRDMRLVQEYLGHTNVRNTARYMDGVSARFRGIWDQVRFGGMNKLRTAGVITQQLFVSVAATYLTWKLALWLGIDREWAVIAAVLIFSITAAGGVRRTRKHLDWK